MKPRNRATLLTLAIAATIWTNAPAVSVRAGVLQDEAAHAVGRWLRPHAKAEVRDLVADWIGIPRDDAKDLIDFLRRTSADETVLDAELPASQRILLNKARQAYGRNCGRDEDPAKLLKVVPLPGPGASDRQVACAYLHNAAVAALKYQLRSIR